jgi:hypothetical protein
LGEAPTVDPQLKTAGFSLRECCKQLVLLEDHLAHPNKRCSDCIHKHQLAAEAFAEEACTLPGAEAIEADLPNVAQRIRGARGGADVRSVRKELAHCLRRNGLGGLDEASQASRYVPVLIGAVGLWYVWSRS